MTSRDVQSKWASQPVAVRLTHIQRLRHQIATRAEELAQCIARPAAETLVSEVLPLADACRFLERRAGSALAPRIPYAEDRPSWLRGVEVELRREPLGVILVIGPVNYPLFLPAVQAIQAMAAGNAVLWKPGRAGGPVAEAFLRCCERAGFPSGLIEVTKEDVGEVTAALDRGVDKVVLTGSAETGRTVLHELARRVVPAVMELSGCDPVIIWRGADLDRVVKALRFGATWNHGDTCIAPKRLIVLQELVEPLRARAKNLVEKLPLQPVGTEEEAIAAVAQSRYALGASVFGSENEARGLAERIRAGVVVVNDIIVPTADPRIPFGGQGLSGFGKTRGLEGLLELTALKAVVVRRGRWLPHLQPTRPGDEKFFASYIRWAHADGWLGALRAARSLVQSAMVRGRANANTSSTFLIDDKDEVA